jgi:hypothetical protein
MTTVTASEHSVVRPIAMIFSLNDDLVFRALDGLSPEELWRAPTARNNAMLWIAGHVVQTRIRLLQMLGEVFETGWGGLFDRGAAVGDTATYPPRTEIERVLREVSPLLQTRLSSLTDEFLAGPPTIQLPGATTMADQIGFFALHDAYHVGQMSYVRKSLGYPSLVG